MPNQAGGEREAHFVQSLERGLSVITAFGPDTESLTLSDVARLTGLTRAAARRFLLTLVDLGYVRQDGKRFALTREGAGPGLRVPLRPLAAGGRRAAPRAAVPRPARVVVDVGARRPRHRVRRPRPDLAHHDGHHQHRHPLPGVRHLDGARAAGRARRRPPRGATCAPSTSSGSPPTPSPTRRQLRASLDEVREQRPRPRRPGARARPAVARGPGARQARDGGGRRQRLLAHQPGHQGKARRQFLPPLLRAVSDIESDLSRTR